MTVQERMLYSVMYLNADVPHASRFKQTVQLRHAEYGLYQGAQNGMMFWAPYSGVPEAGVFEFPSEDAANQFAEFLLANASDMVSSSDLRVEPYDYALAGRMRAEGVATELPKN